MATEESSYDPSLSYEERRRLRREKRETAKQVQNQSSRNGSVSSSISSYRSSSSPSPTPSSNYLPSTQKHLQNGDTRSITNGRTDDSDRRRFHSTSPETNTSSSSSATPAQISLVDSRVHPMSGSHSGRITKVRTNSDSTLLEKSKQLPPPLGISRSNTAQLYSPPQSPHSPVVVGMASKHLTGIIGRHQERERSCSPSLETAPYSRNDAFSFENTQKVVNSEKYVAGDHTKHPLNRNLSNGASISSTDTRTDDILRADLTTIINFNADSNVPIDLYGGGDGIDGNKLSRQSTLSSSSSFTYDSFEQLTSPPPPAKSFASGLTFIDTDFQPEEPEPTIIRGSMHKTNVIYGSHDDSNNTVITRIQGSGFFDPSQTQNQADFLEGPNPIGLKEETGLAEKTSEAQSQGKAMGKDSKRSRNSKSPLRHMKRNVTDKIIEEDENELDGGKNGEISSGKNSLKNKKGKEHKDKDKKRSISTSSAPSFLANNPNGEFSPEHKSVKSERRLFGSARKSAVPNTKSKQNKVSQSFRDDLRGKSLSPDSGGLSKLSMPNLAMSSPSSKEGTPESGGSEKESGGVTKKRKISLAQRIKSLMGGSSSKEDLSTKEKIENPVILKTYKKMDVDLPESPTANHRMNTTNSLGQLPSVSDAAELSSAHRTYSLDCISPISERSIEWPISRPDSVTVGGEVGGESGERNNGRTESGSLTESSSVFSQSGYFVSVPDKSKIEESDIDCTLSSSSSIELSKSTVSQGSEGLDSRNSTSNKTTSSAKKSTKTSITSPNSSKKTNSSSGNFSPSGSPRSSKRISTGVSKYSPISTPKDTSPQKRNSDSASVTRKTSGVSSRVTSSNPTTKSSPLGTNKKTALSSASSIKTSSSGSSLEQSSSPRSSQRSVGKSTQSPISGRKAAAKKSVTATQPAINSPKAVRKSGTEQPTTVNSPKAVKKYVTTQLTINSPKAIKKSEPTINSPKAVTKSVTAQTVINSPKAVQKSVTHSPIGTPKTVKTSIQVHISKQSPSGSPKAAKSSSMIHASSLSSPKASPLLTRRVSPSKTTTNSTNNLSSKAALGGGSSSSPKSSPRSSTRKAAPPRLGRVSLDTSKEQGTPNSPSFSRFSKGRQPMKLKSPDQSKVPSPVPKHKIVAQSSSSSSSKPTLEKLEMNSLKRRRIGISSSESPIISPLLEPQPLAKQSESMGMEMNVGSLLARVEQKLSTLATSELGGALKEPDTENPIPAEFKSSSAVFSFSQQSSQDINSGGSREDSPSPEVFQFPESSQSGVVQSLKRDIVKYPLTISASDTIEEDKKSGEVVTKKSTASSTKKPPQSVDQKNQKSSFISPQLRVNSKSSSVLSNSFTVSRPPRAPSSKKMSEPNISSSTKRPSISSTGMSRPKNIVVATSRKNSSTPSLQNTSAQSNSTPSSTLSAIKAGEKKEFKKSQSSSELKRPSTGTSPSRGSTLNRSTRTRKSSRVRPGSAATLLHRNSTQQNIAGGTPNPLSVGQTSNRKSMRRVSSGDILTKKIRPGSSATLGRDRRGSAVAATSASGSGIGGGGNVFNSMRRPKSSSVLRPSVGAGPGFTRSSATMSMRQPRTSVVQRGGTLRKSRKGTPPAVTVSMVEASLTSPSRSSTLKRVSSSGTMKKNSTGEIFSAFDQISSQASSVLTSSDHRRAVRPRMRQKASASHLKMLNQRQDVTSEILSNDDGSPKVDPNDYATYMSKKNLAPSAMAGLAARVDFSTVKLRKTGTFDVSDQAGSSVDNMSASPNPAAGMDYSTTHPVMLLLIKGRRNIQTRLVEPVPSSLNSGDVFLLVTKDKLFHWVGKSSNIIEKARGSDVVMRIIHKKELSCKATSAIAFNEEERLNTKKENDFWELLGGKKGVKSSESAPGDEVYEKAVNLSTTVYLLEGDKDTAKFVPIHENTIKMVNVSLLHTKNILLFDFYSEMYVWIGNQSPAAMRRKAMDLAKKKFDGNCKHPAFNLRSSPARASGRYRPRSSIRSPRQSVINASGRRSSRVSLSDTKARPDWALFGRMTEGSEHILFREKFCDWPEQGRIIKMKGHESSGEAQTQPIRQVELEPADVSKMLNDPPSFEGLRLEGDNIYRGQGNYKISKSSFSCNRVRTISVSKWVIKEFDNVTVPSQNNGIFYTHESYVVRWGFQITVVRTLEGLVPGQGMFAKDRAHQKKLREEKEGKSTVQTPPVRKSAAPPGDECDSDSSEEEDEEEKRMLESGGRDRCAYFFWQGDNCTVNEKGASALMTMELDKERGPQVRVSQGKEPPAFLNLFQGGLILLNGRSETDSLQSKKRGVRVFCVRVQVKSEASLVEVTSSDEKKNVNAHLRSRGCFVIYHMKKNRLFLWYGSKSTTMLRKSGLVAAKMLRNRLNGTELVRVNEGEEPKDLCNLLGKKDIYVSLAKETRFTQYTPRLFELSSIIGEFIATEVTFPARNGEVEAFTFEQNDLYSVIQPALFLVDGFYEIYIWLGWWPDQKNKLLKEANATTGSSHSKWLRDKKLALETAQNYVKACNRTRTPRSYVVMAGTEHEKFKNLFPFWEENKTVQELNCQGKPIPKRLDVEEELLKYSRTKFTLNELKQKPPPEGVDPSKLESYLSDEEFNKIFKMDKLEFSKMPLWKQTSLKKGAGLF